MSGSGDAAKPVSVTRVVAAIGVVFGDIATSPLYTLQECLAGKHGVEPDRDNVLGCVSLIVWSLLLVVSLKYVAVLMRADNKGEGGIMALLALVPRRLRERSPGTLGVMTLLIVIGAAFLFGDGIITPAISVLAAVEGLRVASPDISDGVIVGIAVVILIGLFAVQSRGSGKLGSYFGPVMALWLLTAGTLGVIHAVQGPAIFQALSPHHAIRFLGSQGFHGFRVLGGVVLSVTGGEALYADMGHFGRRPIRIGWYAFALPMLLLCYLGQGALIIEHPAAAEQPFFAMVPAGAASYPFVLLGTLGTVIASQALITGVFSLVHQSVQLGYFPRVSIRHTSRDERGEIYVPLLNAFLAVSCIALVVSFQKSARLAAAFGLAVSATMAVTSLAFYTVARIHFRWSALRAGALVALFLVVDLAFVVANALKFFDGGFIPAIVAFGFVLVMVIWARGRSLLGEHFRRQAEPVSAFLGSLTARVDRRLSGVCVAMSASADSMPPVLLRMVRRFRSLHEIVLLTTVVTEEVPHVTADRIEIEDLGQGLFRLRIRYGFMETPSVHGEVVRALQRIAPDKTPDDVTYLIGHERFVAGPGGAMGRVAEGFFALLSRNARNPSDYYDLPPHQVVELGARIDL